MYYLVCSSKQLQGIGVVILILQNRKLKFLPQVLELRMELGAESGTAGAQGLVLWAPLRSPLYPPGSANTEDPDRVAYFSYNLHVWNFQRPDT